MSRKLKGGAIVDASVTSTQIDPAIINKITDAYNQANTALSTGGSGSAQANLAYATANLAYSQANAAYGKANTGTTIAENAYGQANNAYAAANNAAVRVSANSGTSISANTISFNNTSTITVTVTGSGANANIEFTAVGGAAYDQANAGYAQANAARTTANDAYAQANAAYGQANAAYGEANLKLNLSGGVIVGDLTVDGNLFVNGAQTIVNTNSLTVNDPIFLLANNNTTNSVGLGIVAHYGPTQQHTGLVRAHQDNLWYLFEDYDDHILYANNVLDTGNIKLATLRANVNANSLLLLGNTVATQANLTLAHNDANAAYAQANAARTTANDAYGQANSAYNQANGAFGAANAVYNTANSAANTVRVSQNGASTLSAKQLNFVNTGNVKIVVTDSGDGNANIAFDATISRTNTSIYSQSFVAANGDQNLTYTLNYTPWGVDYVSVYKNGISLSPTVEYTLSGNVVTVVPAGETNDDIDIRYIVDASFIPQSNTTIIIDANTVAAQTNTFYLSQNVTTVNRLAVSKNGLRLTPNSHYTLTDNNVVTLAAVAEVSDELVFEYFFDLGNVVDWTLAYNQANAAYTAANNRVLKAGDTMTGQLNISSGGLLVTGNVGIGVTNPYSRLTITGSSVSWGEGITINPAPNGYSAVYFRTEAATNDTATNSWAFGKNASDQTGGELLHVVRNSLTGSALHRADAVQSWQPGGNTCFGFNVGIGTTNPTGKLHVAGSIVQTTNADATFSQDIRLSRATRPTIYPLNNNLSVQLASTGTGQVQLNTDFPGDVVMVLGGGKVGISVESPSAKLHVEDGSMLLGDISGGSTSTPSGYKLQFDNSYAPGTTDSSYAPKIVMHQAATWLGGFGISDSHVDYFSGAHHRWFTGTNPNTPTRGTLRLKIWDSGYITMPTQTMISARHNATEAPTAGNALLNWTVDVNQGGGSWNSGTGAYTVPVAGRYMVTCSLLRNTGGAAGGIILHKNGVSVNRMFYVDSVGTTGYGMGSGQIIVDCGAGDSLRFMNENTVSWYGDGAGLGSFTINLLG